MLVSAMHAEEAIALDIVAKNVGWWRCDAAIAAPSGGSRVVADSARRKRKVQAFSVFENLRHCTQLAFQWYRDPDRKESQYSYHPPGLPKPRLAIGARRATVFLALLETL